MCNLQIKSVRNQDTFNYCSDPGVFFHAFSQCKKTTCWNLHLCRNDHIEEKNHIETYVTLLAACLLLLPVRPSFYPENADISTCNFSFCFRIRCGTYSGLCRYDNLCLGCANVTLHTANNPLLVMQLFGEWQQSIISDVLLWHCHWFSNLISQ